MDHFHWCIDVGNSSIKWGVFLGNQLIEVFQFREDPTTDQLQILESKFSPHRIAVCSVRTELNWFDYPKAEWLSAASIGSFQLDYSPPESLGVDRIATALGAQYNWPNASSILVVDLGTCVTYTMLRNRLVSGLAIAPGLQMRWNAMHHYTAKLPLLDHHTSIKANGTLKNLEVGGKVGWQKELEGLIDLFCETQQIEQVVITGSDVVHLENHFKDRFVIMDHLHLWGLNYWLNEG
jgi:type III pantothenate kinase